MASFLWRRTCTSWALSLHNSSRCCCRFACAWAAEQERTILQTGVGLQDSQLADARRVGVARPDRIRLFRVVQIPSPTHPDLAAAASATGLISSLTTGLTVQYGIFIQADCWRERPFIANETLYQLSYTPSKCCSPSLTDQLRTKTIELDLDSASEKTRSTRECTRFTPSYRSSNQARP